ncbi:MULTISPECIES: UPF0058 family protein [Methanocalculus]|uniref:UPF0058 family protein n=1 Tax=Methanocalculus TaxID=71151 RepID=UPI0025FB4F59|nr:UPF0058 family protein [Methanocalculus sp. MSAO_Arc1]
MQKEELIHLHMLMVTVKKYYETVTGDAVSTNKYDSLLISPVHIHKNKNSHKEALLTLADEIVERLHSHSGQLSPEYQGKTSFPIAVKP